MCNHDDNDDTVFQVVVPAPDHGTWTVSVQAKILSKSAAQLFALVITTHGMQAIR